MILVLMAAACGNSLPAAGGGFAFLLFHCVSDSATPYQGSTTGKRNCDILLSCF